MVTRHEFLTMVHQWLQPTTYLEVGVQYGTSLNLASAAKTAIGIDPRPLTGTSGNQKLFSMTSDDFFLYEAGPDLVIDFAFIDGSHLFEDALRDFINVTVHSTKDTVVVFDDVLPYNEVIAGRMPLPGDWTGDVWKIYYILKKYCPHLAVQLVDLFPTGGLLVWNLKNDDIQLPLAYDTIMADYRDTTDPLPVPQEILTRSVAISASDAIFHLDMARTAGRSLAEQFERMHNEEQAA